MNGFAKLTSLILYGGEYPGRPLLIQTDRLNLRPPSMPLKRLATHYLCRVQNTSSASRKQRYQDALYPTSRSHGAVPPHSEFLGAAAGVVERLDAFGTNTCFVYASDRIALGIQQGLKSLGKSMPDDVGVIGTMGSSDKLPAHS